MIAIVALAATGSTVAVTAASAEQPRRGEPRPIVFVHGSGGSGAQFESQAMRFASNGYPADRLHAYEYDSTFGLNTIDQVYAGIDELVTSVLASTGADRVDLIGHSLGTFVLQAYLASSPERAARAAHYVNLDGRTALAPPAGVPTLAVWGEGDPARQIAGAQNHYAPDQSHVQVATSPETFAVTYEFLNGRAPRTTDVVPERPERVRISGRAQLFPSNQGADGSTLDIWLVDRSTGRRIGTSPRATFAIGPDGGWGPFEAHGRKRYELALRRDDGASTQHFYFQPFMRSDHLVRLLTSEPGTGIDLLRDRNETTTSLNITRYKEWWGDKGDENDVLQIAGEDVVTPAIAPAAKRVNALFVFDDGLDGVSDLSAPIADLFALPFVSGADLVVPAGSPPSGSVAVKMVARAGDGEPEVINVPNWPSATDHVSVQFRDFEQDDETWPLRH
ncbi:MAG TPA: alpha/beta fold hydrolase [Acidimicrobiales bacterium]|nr:alpha/beta fold hydrolase [Acidimicrobiales bacterium]